MQTDCKQQPANYEIGLGGHDRRRWLRRHHANWGQNITIQAGQRKCGVFKLLVGQVRILSEILATQQHSGSRGDMDPAAAIFFIAEDVTEKWDLGQGFAQSFFQ